jgi:5-methylcytosine-specific restriction endonuclease McrA
VKAEAGQRCERCGRADLPLVVHHRTRVADGGSHARHNLEVICQACSELEHGGKGYRR